ncbi:MAG TPA: biopolymer transporter ExbD [Burkholderiales bacterium]|nr:biopolymer transporter ExbD [Burkholderiales bacterium]
MAFGGFSKSGDNAPMAEINMIPLIDVMLVLLVIFIITAPLLTNAVKISLPTAASSPTITKPEHHDLAIDAAGVTYWDGAALDRPQLVAKLHEAAQQNPQPEVHLRADRTTQYQVIDEILSECAKAGVTRIGFISDPNRENH